MFDLCYEIMQSLCSGFVIFTCLIASILFYYGDGSWVLNHIIKISLQNISSIRFKYSISVTIGIYFDAPLKQHGDRSNIHRGNRVPDVINTYGWCVWFGILLPRIRQLDHRGLGLWIFHDRASVCWTHSSKKRIT